MIDTINVYFNWWYKRINNSTKFQTQKYTHICIDTSSCLRFGSTHVVFVSKQIVYEQA